MNCNICKKKYKNEKALIQHIIRSHKIKIEEYYLNFIGEEGTCEICGNKTKFVSLFGGYKKACSKECGAKYGARQVKEKFDNMTEDEIKNHFQYIPTLHHSKSDKEKQQIIKKRKQTKLEKYGDENYNNISQLKKTILNYSDERKKEILNKRVETCNQKYGVDYITQTKEYKNSVKKTWLQKYGVDNPQKTIEIQKKAENTKLEKYGDKYYRNIEKSKKTRYKTSYQIVLDRLMDTTIPLFTLESFDGVGDRNKIFEFHCTQCENKFESYLKDGKIPRCPTCNPPQKSNFENEISEFLTSIGIDYHRNDRKIIHPNEIDIFIPNKNIAIECNGLYWHSELNGKDKNYHLNKTKECEKQNIQLIHIFEDEWMMKPNIVKNRLKAILGMADKTIYARNCEIKEITSKTSNEFLENYHIQGKDKSSVRFGAFYNDQLVSVMTFGKLRLSLGNKNKPNHYEMIRFCVGETNVVGIANKLFKQFINLYDPEQIISYADRRWSVKDNVYCKLNFKLESEGYPNYWYISNTNWGRFHRFNFRKDVLNEKLEKFDNNLSEWQNMQINGWDRIWDCGSLKYVWKVD